MGEDAATAELRLSQAEVDAVCRMLALAREVLDPDGVQPSEPGGDPLDAMFARYHEPHDGEPEDPALARLLPSGSRDDPEAAAEYRRLTEPGLRARKIAGLDRCVRALRAGTPPRIPLTDEEAVALTVALTDARLVLGERLGLDADDDEIDRMRALARLVMSEVPHGTRLSRSTRRPPRLGSRFDLIAGYLHQLAQRVAEARAAGLDVSEETRAQVVFSVHYHFLTVLQDGLSAELLRRG